MLQTVFVLMGILFVSLLVVTLFEWLRIKRIVPYRHVLRGVYCAFKEIVPALRGLFPSRVRRIPIDTYLIATLNTEPIACSEEIAKKTIREACARRGMKPFSYSISTRKKDPLELGMHIEKRYLILIFSNNAWTPGTRFTL